MVTIQILQKVAASSGDSDETLFAYRPAGQCVPKCKAAHDSAVNLVVCAAAPQGLDLLETSQLQDWECRLCAKYNIVGTVVDQSITASADAPGSD